MDTDGTLESETQGNGQRWLLLAAMCLVVVVVFVVASDAFLLPPDPACYWSWGESVVTDLDYSFIDEFTHHSMPVRYTWLTATGRISNDWPIGTGLVLAPWVLLGRTLAHGWVVALVLGMLAAWRRLFPAVSRGAWAAGACAALLGTPLFFYTVFAPFYSHAASFVATAAFLAAWMRSEGERPRHTWLLLGLLLGWAALMRPQNVLLGLVFVTELRQLRIAPRTYLLGAAVAAGGFLVGFAPQLSAYVALYGSPFALPKIEEMHWLRPSVGRFLFSDYHGLLLWTPIYALACAGLFAIARTSRRVALGLALVLAAQCYINSANWVWWAGGSFGNRRMADLAIVVAIGVAALWDARPERTWKYTVGAAATACIAWTMLLALAERRLLLPLDHYVPFDGAFVAALGAVFKEPRATVASLIRWEPTVGNVALRVLGGLVAAAGMALGTRWKSQATGPTVARAALAAATIVALLCGIAALRTEGVDDERLLSRLSTSPTIVWDNHMEIAHYHWVRGESRECEEAARAAIAIEPDNYSSWSMLGLALLDQDRWAESEAAFLRALELNPGHERSHEGLARARARRRWGV